MKYNFKIDDNDYYELNKYHVYNTPSIKRRMIITRIILPVFLIVVPFIIEQTQNTQGIQNIQGISYVFHGIFIVMALAVFIFYNQITNFSLRRRIKKLKKTGKLYCSDEITYEFLEDSFIKTTSDSKSVINYSSIQKISLGKYAYYLYDTIQSAHILPFRVFANDDERKAFYDFIQGKVTDTKKAKY